MCTALGEALDVVGVGNVCITLLNGNVWTLQQIRHIPILKKNLIFLGQHDGCGNTKAFSKGEWKAKKGSLVLAHRRKNSTMHLTSRSIDVQENKGF